MANIFDTLKRITVSKEDWKDIPEDEKESFNKYMCNRFLSMDKDYCELVNEVQSATWQMSPEYLYKIYKDIIPKRQVYLKYMKVSKKSEHKAEVVEVIMQHYEISKKDAKEYLDLMSKVEIKELLEEYGK